MATIHGKISTIKIGDQEFNVESLEAIDNRLSGFSNNPCEEYEACPGFCRARSIVSRVTASREYTARMRFKGTPIRYYAPKRRRGRLAKKILKAIMKGFWI